MYRLRRFFYKLMWVSNHLPKNTEGHTLTMSGMMGKRASTTPTAVGGKEVKELLELLSQAFEPG